MKYILAFVLFALLMATNAFRLRDNLLQLELMDSAQYKYCVDRCRTQQKNEQAQALASGNQNYNQVSCGDQCDTNKYMYGEA